MIKSVQHGSYKEFRRLNRSNPGGYDSRFGVVTKDTHAFISIRGTDPEDIVKPYINRKIWHSGIMMIFDDIDYPLPGFQMISPEHCREIIDYVTELHRLPQPITLIVHCFAGISRSAAVAKWVNDAFELDLPQYHERFFHNTHVYSELVKAQWGSIINTGMNSDTELTDGRHTFLDF
jgi:predicted protein tyrosine phosphatase